LDGLNLYVGSKAFEGASMEHGIYSYLPAIEIMMCHLGMSFDEACEEMGLSQDERLNLLQLQQQSLPE